MTVSAANIQVSSDLPAATKYTELRYIAGAMTVVQALSWLNRNVGASVF